MESTLNLMHMLWWMGGNPSGQAEPNPFLSFLPFILIIVIIYFLMIRPQKKRQLEREKMLNSIEKGDKIVTVGGIHGVVQNLTQNNTLIVKIADNVKVEIERSAVATVLRGNKPNAAEMEQLIKQPEKP